MKKYLSVFMLVVLLTTACSSGKKAASGEPGTSFQTAIPVNSVEEEYDYIKKNCGDCRIVKQTLMFYKNKPFDIITTKAFQEKEKDYYFDISSFYGKN